MPYDSDELAALVRGGESHLVEFKRSVADRRAIRRNICAFANDGPGTGKAGVLFVGIQDDGTCAGATIDDAVLKKLALMRSDGSIQPLPAMRVDAITIANCRVAAVQVEPSRSPPVRFEGRVWVKVGPTVQQATIEDEQRLVERRRASELPYDCRPVTGASVDQLDNQYIAEVYLRSAVAEEVLAENRRSLVHQMESLGLLIDGKPTWGALLAAARHPQTWLRGAYVQCLQFDGVRLTSAVRTRRELTGKLEDVLNRLDHLVDTLARMRIDMTSASRELRWYDYPPAALKQLVRNAVMHRSYETTAPVRIYWFDDRIDVESPGGLYGRVTLDNISKGVTDYRNPLVAEIMHRLGFAQRFGVGIPIAKEALRENCSPPLELRASHSSVTVTLRPRIEL